MSKDVSSFLAIDLGATSGRSILGCIKDGRLSVRELTRFPNGYVRAGGHYHWDIYALYSEIVKALRQVADEGVRISSIGIDSWGCDFALIGKDGGLLRAPYSYRDPHTDGAMEEYFRLIPKELVYEKTGIQFMNFNSLFQLAAMRRHSDSALEVADKLLFIPDALAYMLTGEAVCEYTVLSTSQMLNPRAKRIDADLISVIGLREEQFGRYVFPGEMIGTLSEEIQKQTGLGAVPVIAVAGHDTASAVAAVPAADAHFAYLSCGTWSLLGIETAGAIINARSLELNFTNEGGVDGTTRFLKNICGMWILERCRAEWGSDAPDIATLCREAMNAPAFHVIIDPDHKDFANPESMNAAIREYCARTRQPAPEDYRQTARCIFESLALRYREVLESLREFSPLSIDRLHVIGGGCRNEYLMQMTADSCGMPVLTGPVEGTAIGNLMLQARAAGLVGDIWQMRSMIADSIETRLYTPGCRTDWDRAYERYGNIRSAGI